jgi:hypothetical protein
MTFAPGAASAASASANARLYRSYAAHSRRQPASNTGVFALS